MLTKPCRGHLTWVVQLYTVPRPSQKRSCLETCLWCSKTLFYSRDVSQTSVTFSWSQCSLIPWNIRPFKISKIHSKYLKFGGVNCKSSPSEIMALIASLSTAEIHHWSSVFAEYHRRGSLNIHECEITWTDSIHIQKSLTSGSNKSVSITVLIFLYA